ncbi:Toluene efflux pump membrane transporter TtgE [Shimia sp. SK013]|uniref:efflux RND transporter permease subunit n=1 Tax=Shimia sp. SK013 TaxID=1389006 RepID=UPI0006CC9CF6|nr:efflux RND transporter permease subunit [Shimia sp. SK013]KPA22283.1 Toluene efflux pump membrane transporter TtgE [Shimia sp. SK013]
MVGIVDWAAERARMVLAFIALSLVVGGYAYWGLPKEGEPDIQIPGLFVSVPFPGISAADSEAMLVKPMETELSDLDGLDKMSATASENYAGIFLEFEFGWDKSKTMADVREAMNTAEGKFPEGFEKYTINEINFSEFPIVIVNLTGRVPERTMFRIAKDLQDKIEGLDAVLEAGIAGQRDEMLEVVIDPLRLESYNVSAQELIDVVVQNNQLIAAGEIDSAQGTFAVKIPSSFSEPRDVYGLPVKTNGDRVVTLGDLAEINLTFEDRAGTARFNGESTVALQVVKRKGFNLIDTAAEVRDLVENASSDWPSELQSAVHVGTSNDQSRVVGSMVSQLEGSVLTAIALVMIVVLTALGTRAALLVGFAIPTSFLLCFALLAAMEITISNIVMFGLILAVGMLVDGAIVVVEYADKRIKAGVGPMHAYVEAAKRMFWPIVSSTATTLCAFLPMLFWPGVPGQFMGMLPVTLIFVLSASLVVALVYLPVMGGVSGRLSRVFGNASDALRARLHWTVRFALVPVALWVLFLGAMQALNPDYILGLGSAIEAVGQFGIIGLPVQALLIGGPFMVAAMIASIVLTAARIERKRKNIKAGFRLSPFGWFIKLIAGNPIMPLVSVVAVIAVVLSVFGYFGQNNKGVEFFVESEPEQAIVYVLARGNLSLEQKDALVKQAESVVLAHPGIQSSFAFAGEGGLNTNTGGAQAPKDMIGQIQIETIPWEDRPIRSEPWITIPGINYAINREVKDERFGGHRILNELTAELEKIPGVKIEILEASRGPASAKPVHLRVKGDNWEDLIAAATLVRAEMDQTAGLINIEDTRPLPGIDWEISVDVAKAGRYGANVATVGGMVQLVTRGILLDTMRVDSSDEEIEIRVRLPEEDRFLSTLDTLKVRTAEGLVPLSNFVTRKPVAKLAEINRVDQTRYFDVKAGVSSGLTILHNPETNEREVIDSAVWNSDDALKQVWADKGFVAEVMTPNERITTLTQWLETKPLPVGVDWEWTGDQEDEAESQAFLSSAFMGALFLMFIILLAQFNSFYNAFLVLLAVVLSTTGVLIGMLVMDQAFSIIMTGTGIVALAGIVVNNNIVLIDTYQEYSRYMPRIEAIVRTAQSRIRPVLLTTITTMAGLAPMMYGLSLDFINGGYAIDSPTSLWWKQLATAVVFGLGIATVLTLVFTPSMLAIRVWAGTYFQWMMMLLKRLSLGSASKAGQDWALRRAARKVKQPVLLWDDDTPVEAAKEDAPAKPEPTAEDIAAAEAAQAVPVMELAPEVEAPREAAEGDVDAPHKGADGLAAE